MRTTLPALAALATASAVIVAPAAATITITQTADPAPTYSTVLPLNAPGAPTGLLPSNTWSDLGVIIGSGDNLNAIGVADVSGTFPWVDAGNVLDGPFGIFMTFTAGIDAISFQAWDPSGPPSPFGGGMAVVAFDEGGNKIGFESFTPAWGGLGDTWFNVVATEGMVIHELRILGFGFPFQSFVGNVSFQQIPAPGAIALLGLAGLAGRRNRRSL